MSLADLQKQVFSNYRSPFEDKPPPLKQATAVAVAEELGINRGDPAEKRHLEQQLQEQKQRVAEMEILLKRFKEALSTGATVNELQLTKMRMQENHLLEENTLLKSTNETMPTDSEELLKMISKERAAIRREKEQLDRDRLSFENEKQVLVHAQTSQSVKALHHVSPAMTMGSVIAQKVSQYMATLEGCGKQELKEVRLGLEEMLAQRLSDIEN